MSRKHLIGDTAKSEHTSSLPGGAPLASLVHTHLAQYRCAGLHWFGALGIVFYGGPETFEGRAQMLNYVSLTPPSIGPGPQ